MFRVSNAGVKHNFIGGIFFLADRRAAFRATLVARFLLVETGPALAPFLILLVLLLLRQSRTDQALLAARSILNIRPTLNTGAGSTCSPRNKMTMRFTPPMKLCPFLTFLIVSKPFLPVSNGLTLCIRNWLALVACVLFNFGTNYLRKLFSIRFYPGAGAGPAGW